MESPYNGDLLLSILILVQHLSQQSVGVVQSSFEVSALSVGWVGVPLARQMTTNQLPCYSGQRKGTAMHRTLSGFPAM